MLMTLLKVMKIDHCYRENNFLAKEATPDYTSSNSTTYLEVAPTDICNILNLNAR